MNMKNLILSEHTDKRKKLSLQGKKYLVFCRSGIIPGWAGYDIFVWQLLVPLPRVPDPLSMVIWVDGGGSGILAYTLLFPAIEKVIP